MKKCIYIYSVIAFILFSCGDGKSVDDPVNCSKVFELGKGIIQNTLKLENAGATSFAIGDPIYYKISDGEYLLNTNLSVRVYKLDNNAQFKLYKSLFNTANSKVCIIISSFSISNAGTYQIRYQISYDNGATYKDGFDVVNMTVN